MSDAAGLDVERRFCLRAVRFLSSTVMDPHLYFERKWSAEIGAIESGTQLRAATGRLLAWIDTMGLDAQQRAQLDEVLASDGLPTLEEMRGRLRET